MIRCNGGMVYFNKIVGSGVHEFRAYQSLSDERKREIISLFWTNLVKFFLLNKMENSNWKEATAKDDAQSMFSREIPNAIFLKLKEKKEEGYLAISVSYDEKLCTAEIKSFVIADDKTKKEKYEREIQKALISIEKSLSQKITKMMVLKYCFETLYSQRLCKVRGNDAVTMYQIMCRANKHYPKFAKLSQDKKVGIIRTGYLKGMKVSARYRDVYSFSMATFEALELAGMADIVYKYNPIINKYSTYERCGQSPYCVPGATCPRFINYLVKTKSGATYQTSFLSFDLWELLATTC